MTQFRVSTDHQAAKHTSRQTWGSTGLDVDQMWFDQPSPLILSDSSMTNFKSSCWKHVEIQSTCKHCWTTRGSVSTKTSAIWAELSRCAGWGSEGSAARATKAWNTGKQWKTLWNMERHFPMLWRLKTCGRKAPRSPTTEEGPPIESNTSKSSTSNDQALESLESEPGKMEIPLPKCFEAKMFWPEIVGI